MQRGTKRKSVWAAISASAIAIGALVGIPVAATAATAPPEVTLLPSQGSSTHAAQYPTQCGNVLFVGARGSDEKDASNSKTLITMGQTVQRVRDALQSDLAALRDSEVIRQTYLDSTDYKAPAATTAVTNPTAYASSVNTGAARLEAYLSKEALQCPTEQWVLAGFSQGSQVVDEALAWLSSSSQAWLLSRLDGVFTVANPWNAPLDNFTHAGDTKQTPTGVFSFRPHGLSAANKLLGPIPKFTSALRPLAISYCHQNDPICNFDGQQSALAVLNTDKDHGKAYYRDNGIYASVNTIAQSVVAHKVATPTSTPTPTPTASADPITDPGLDACVAHNLQNQLGSPVITAATLAKLTSLTCSAPDVYGDGYTVNSLVGLEFATSLTSLDIERGGVTTLIDIEALPLTSITIHGAVATLAGLAYDNPSTLTTLKIYGGTLKDAGIVSTLRSLTDAEFYGQQITNVSTLTPFLDRTRVVVGSEAYSLNCPLSTSCNLPMTLQGFNTLIPWTYSGDNGNDCGVSEDSTIVTCYPYNGSGATVNEMEWMDTYTGNAGESFFYGALTVSTNPS